MTNQNNDPHFLARSLPDTAGLAAQFGAGAGVVVDGVAVAGGVGDRRDPFQS